jgi:5,10-methylenetetrahydrofolate reductase
MSRLQESLARGAFTVTGEVGPAKGTSIEHAKKDAAHLKGRVVAVNVTDNAAAVMHMGSMAVSHLLADWGLEPVFQMVCRDRNRIALQSDLLSAAALGIENVLVITGDHTTMGDHREAMPVYDLDSVGLLDAMTKLESGTDLGVDMKGQPNALDGAPAFFKGCCVTPCADAVEPQVIKLEKKVAAGAQFCQTQAVYDPAAFEAFMKKVEGLGIPILVGIVLLKSAGMAKYMNRGVPGVTVPDAIIGRLADAAKEDRQKVSVEIAGTLIRRMKDMCQGAHIMTLGWDRCDPGILDVAGLTPSNPV